MNERRRRRAGGGSRPGSATPPQAGPAPPTHRAPAAEDLVVRMVFLHHHDHVVGPRERPDIAGRRRGRFQRKSAAKDLPAGDEAGNLAGQARAPRVRGPRQPTAGGGATAMINRQDELPPRERPGDREPPQAGDRGRAGQVARVVSQVQAQAAAGGSTARPDRPECDCARIAPREGRRRRGPRGRRSVDRHARTIEPRRGRGWRGKRRGRARQRNRAAQEQAAPQTLHHRPRIPARRSSHETTSLPTPRTRTYPAAPRPVHPSRGPRHRRYAAVPAAPCPYFYHRTGKAARRPADPGYGLRNRGKTV